MLLKRYPFRIIPSLPPKGVPGNGDFFPWSLDEEAINWKLQSWGFPHPFIFSCLTYYRG